MSARHPARAIILTAAATVLLSTLSWSAGYLYWHFTIQRAIRELERRTHSEDRRPEDVVAYPDELLQARSRAVPYLLRAVEQSLASRDQSLAVELLCCLSHVVERADRGRCDYIYWETNFVSPNIRGGRAGESIEDMSQAHAANLDWWETNHEKFPAWWVWWSGKRRSK